MRRTHLSLDVRDDCIYWVRSRQTARGVTVIASGCHDRRASTAIEEPLAQRRLPSAVPSDPARVALDAPGVVLRRENLPAMKTSEASLIAGRRAPDILGASDEEACFAWLHGASGRAAPLWLCAAPMARAREAHESFTGRGVDVQLLCSRQLALGHLVRLLPRMDEPGLTAILDLDAGRGTCVLADHEGWVFGREFPLHDLSEPGGFEADVDSDESDAARATAGSQEHSSMHELEPEMLDIWAMRLATELRRTFRYVDGELALGKVTRVCVSGSSTRVAAICALLSNRLELPATLLSEAIRGGPADGLSNAAAVALGLALWPSEAGGNLLPAKLIAERARIAARRHLLIAFGCVAAILAIAAATVAVVGRSARSQLGELEAQLEAARPDRDRVAEHEQTRQRAAQLELALARIDQPLPSLSGLLTALSRLAPDSVHVENIRIAWASDAWTLRLDVEADGESVAEAASAVSDLAHALRASPLLELDRVVQNDIARITGEHSVRARTHVRFLLDGRLAPLAEHANASTPQRAGDAGDGDV